MNDQLKLRAAATRNRTCATAAEAALWQWLRKKQLGVHFRRQFPLLNRYIADFYAPAAKLVVEIDGGYHDAPARRRADGRRARALMSRGLRVVRLSNELVLGDASAAVELVRRALRRA
jgi:very-short-patch-repair endonuclease